MFCLISHKIITIAISSFRQEFTAFTDHTKKWKQHTASHGIDPGAPSPVHVGNFLAHLFQGGASYSAVNTVRSALSAFLPL